MTTTGAGRRPRLRFRVGSTGQHSTLLQTKAFECSLATIECPRSRASREVDFTQLLHERTSLLCALLLGLAIACARTAAATDDVIAFRALFAQAEVKRGDTVCVSVKSGGGEIDPHEVVAGAINPDVTVLPLSRCKDNPLIRLREHAKHGDTLTVDGDVVAEHSRRYRCLVELRTYGLVRPCEMQAPSD